VRVKSSVHITLYLKRKDPSVANEKQVREDELCSLFMPVGYFTDFYKMV